MKKYGSSEQNVGALEIIAIVCSDHICNNYCIFWPSDQYIAIIKKNPNLKLWSSFKIFHGHIEIQYEIVLRPQVRSLKLRSLRLLIIRWLSDDCLATDCHICRAWRTNESLTVEAPLDCQTRVLPAGNVSTCRHLHDRILHQVYSSLRSWTLQETHSMSSFISLSTLGTKQSWLSCTCLWIFRRALYDYRALLNGRI